MVMVVVNIIENNFISGIIVLLVAICIKNNDIINIIVLVAV